MSKRKTPDKPDDVHLDLPALLTAEGFRPAQCRLVRARSGSVWVTAISHPALQSHLAEQVATALEIHVPFVVAGVVGAGAGGAGFISFVGSSVRFKKDLQQLEVASAQLEPTLIQRLACLPPQQQRADGGLSWQALLQQIAHYLRDMLEQFHDLILAEITGRQDKAANYRDLRALQDTQVILTKGRTQFDQNFMARWRKLSHQDGTQAAPGVQTADWRLVDKAQFEDKLALQMVATAIASPCRDPLFAMDQYVGQLAGSEAVPDPLSPGLLCQCLHYAMVRHNLPDTVKPTFYRAFESVLQDSWPRFLQMLTQACAQAGLLALPLEKMRSNWSILSKGRGERRAPLASPSSPAGESPASGSASSNVLNVARLWREMERDWPDADAALPLTAVRDELLNHRGHLLDALRLGDTSLEAAIGRLPSVASHLSGEAWDRIGVVDRLVDPLLHNPKLSTELVRLLGLLKWPLMKTLLEDTDFLEDDQHPVRVAFNRVAEVCAGDRISGRHLELALSQVIDDLVEAKSIDETLLKDVNERLDALLARQSQAFARHSERIAKARDGQLKLKQARQAVQARLSMQLSGREVPVPLLTLLADGWEQLLVLTLLKEGPESHKLAELFDAVAHLRDWLVAVEQDKVLERELEMPSLVDMIEAELNAGLAGSNTQSLLRQLRELALSEMPADTRFLTHYPPASGANPQDGGQSDDAPVAAQQGSVPRARWRERAYRIRVGDWLDVKDAEAGWLRVRLVWSDPEGQHFVLLSRRGLQEIDLSHEQLVDGFHRGDLRRIEQRETSYVDQSMFDMMQGVYGRLAFQATHDPLTGCLQRHEFEKQLERVLLQAANVPQDGALLVVDIDQFSLINNSYGSAAGDRLLREVRPLVLSWLGEQADAALIGRLGGNEFGLVLSPCERDMALDVANRICRQFAVQPLQHEGREFKVNVSIGVAFIDEQTVSAELLLGHGSLACSSAKKTGGGRMRPFNEADKEQAHQQEVMSWVSRIDRAVKEGALYLRAQRIMPLMDSKALDRYEILLGVNDASGQQVSPATFIEAAEKYNRSSLVDRWVVEEVLAWMQANPEKLAQIESLSINLSGRSLSDDAFLAFLESKFRSGAIPSHKICFEITETAAVANINYTADFMRELKRSGCRFSLDDFGTGMASYAYLQRLPVDYLKIDGVFVKDMTENMTNYALVRSINELGHFLGMHTIAEYVENIEIMEALREIRVDSAQGYGIAKPKRLADI